MQAWRTERLTGLGLLILTTLIWGSTFPLVEGAVAHVPPVQFVAWRFGLAALCMLPWLRGAGGLRAMVPGAIVGLANAGGFLLQTFALQTASADVVAFLTGLSVILVPAVEAVWRRRWPSALVLWALFAGVLGLGLMTVRHGLTWTQGDLLGALCAVLFAVQVLGTSRLARRAASNRLAAEQVVSGAIVFVVVALAWHRAWLLPPPRSVWPLVVYMGLVATVATFLVQVAGQARVSATTAAITFNLEPVFAAVWAYVLVGQRLDLQGWIGACAVLAGMVMAAVAPSEPDTATPLPAGTVPVTDEDRLAMALEHEKAERGITDGDGTER